jgi:beta-galactosidase beta subunit
MMSGCDCDTGSKGGVNILHITHTYIKVENRLKPLISLVSGDFFIFPFANVSAITKTNVKVTFKALEKADAAFTVEVKDDKGNKVEVNPVSLEVGETEATLTFKTPFGVDPVGVWTVGGVKFDNDAVKNFNDIVTSSSNLNEVTTLAALKKAGLNNIKDGNITAYVTAINASTTKEKLADIQVIVDKTNEISVTAEEATAAVKAVNDATNQVQLLAALQNKAFVRVNADWIVDYKTDIDAAKALGGATFTTTDTVAEIQAIVDAKNSAKIATANTAATTVATQNAVTDLISKYTIDDVAPATTKADAVKASNVKSAVFGVKEATTSATVYNALVKLSALDNASLPASSLNANLKAEYLAAKNLATIDGTTTVSALKTSVVTAADTAALTAASNGIVALTSTSTAADTKAALQKLADVTIQSSDKFDMTKVKDGSLTAYLTALEPLAFGSVDTAAKVTTVIATVNSAANETANLATIKNASATVTQVRDALTELAAGVATNATTTAYLNASSQVKLEVAQFVVDNRSSLAGTLTAAIVTTAGGTNYADAVIETAQAAQVAKVANFNTIGDLSGATISATKAALDAYAYAPYVALTATQQVAVAEEINKLTKPTSATDSTPKSLNFTVAPGSDSVTTIAQANAYIDAAIAKAK